MSDDDESDYSNSDSDSESEEVKKKNLVKKKDKILNAAKQFGNYVEEDSDSESDTEIDDSEPDDVDDPDEEEQKGGVQIRFGDVDDEEQKEEVKDDNVDIDDVDEDDDADDDIEIDEEEGVVIEKENKSNSVKPKKTTQLIIEDPDDEYDDELLRLSKVVRNNSNIIIDPLHKTLPYLTKYEKARIIGQRAKQIETGAKPLVKVPENIIDGYVIAELELKEKKIPFIIKRPIPGGAFEYWRLNDLENINF